MAEEAKEEIIPEVGDPIPKSWLEKAASEMNSSERVLTVSNFRGQEETEIHIIKANVKDDSKCSLAYSRAFNRYLDDEDFKTEDEMEKLLEKRGIWGKKELDRIEKIKDDMGAIAIEICTIRDTPRRADKTAKLKSNWISLRDELGDIAVKKQSYLSNTVEAKAEQEKLKVKLSLCTKFADGTLVWDGLESLENESDQAALGVITHDAILFWSGLNTEIIDGLPDQLFAIGEEVRSEN